MTTQTQVHFLDADFNAKDLSQAQIMALMDTAEGARSAANRSTQHAVYASFYTALASYNKTPLQAVMTRLSNVDGMFEDSIYKNIRQWVQTFLTKCVEKEMLSAADMYNFVSKPSDFSFESHIIIEDNQVMKTDTTDGTEKLVKKVLVPRKDTPEFEELAAFLREYADTHYVMNAMNEKRVALNQKAKAAGKSTSGEKQAQKTLLAMPDEALTAEELAEKQALQVKKHEQQIKSAKKGLEKVADVAETHNEVLEMIRMVQTTLMALKSKEDTLKRANCEKTGLEYVPTDYSAL